MRIFVGLLIFISTIGFAAQNSICFVASDATNSDAYQWELFKEHNPELLRRMSGLGFDVIELDLIKYHTGLMVSSFWHTKEPGENYYDYFLSRISNECSQIWFSSSDVYRGNKLGHGLSLTVLYDNIKEKLPQDAYQHIALYKRLSSKLEKKVLLHEQTQQLLQNLPKNISLAIFTDAFYLGQYKKPSTLTTTFKKRDIYGGFSQPAIGDVLSEVIFNQDAFNEEVIYANVDPYGDNSHSLPPSATSGIFNDIDFSIFGTSVTTGYAVQPLTQNIVSSDHFTPIIQTLDSPESSEFDVPLAGFFEHEEGLWNKTTRRIYLDGAESKIMRFKSALEVDKLYIEKVACALENQDTRPGNCDELDEKIRPLLPPKV